MSNPKPACSILLVEDDADVRESLEDVLRERGYDVTSVGLGREAIEACTTGQFDIGILDVNLPDGSGLDRVPKMETLQPGLEILIITGYTNTDLTKAVRPSTVGFLTKPVNVEQLLSVIARIAERQAVAKQNRELQAAILHARAQYQDLYDNAPDMYLSVDAATAHVIDCNNATVERLGYTKDEIIGRPIFDFYHSSCRDHVKVVFETFKKTGEVRDAELRVVGKDGSVIDVSLNESAVRDAHGNILRTRSIWRDITEHRRLEREILDIGARERLSVGQDLHDGLGQHLTGIAFLSKALAQKLAGQSRPEAADAVEIEKLVNATITQTRNLAKGLHPTALVTGGLQAALEELASTTEQLLDVSCVLAADRAAPLPDDVATQLYCMAQEAITNAVKHGKASNITVVLQATGDTTTLAVEDDGRGFPADREEAQGMGLQIMRYRAGMIDGSLDIRPRPGGGTVFLCSFPTPPTEEGESKGCVGEP